MHHLIDLLVLFLLKDLLDQKFRLGLDLVQVGFHDPIATYIQRGLVEGVPIQMTDNHFQYPTLPHIFQGRKEFLPGRARDYIYIAVGFQYIEQLIPRIGRIQRQEDFEKILYIVRYVVPVDGFEPRDIGVILVRQIGIELLEKKIVVEEYELEELMQCPIGLIDLFYLVVIEHCIEIYDLFLYFLHKSFQIFGPGPFPEFVFR